MEPELLARFTALETKVDDMSTTLKKIRTYFLWTGIITVVLFVLPLIGLVFAVPTFLNSYTQMDSVTGGM